MSRLSAGASSKSAGATALAHFAEAGEKMKTWYENRRPICALKNMTKSAL
jgi:uncharacterized protein YjiS (DUF1127 family)